MSLRTCLLLAVAIVGLSPASPHAAARKGTPAPRIEERGISGAQVSTAALAGKVVVLDFFATWCPPCRESVPRLVLLQKKYGPKGLQIVGLSADVDGEKTVREFATGMRINYPVAIVDDRTVTAYGVRSIPTLVVIDRKGIVREVFAGFSDEIEKRLEQSVKKLLSP